VVGVGNLLLSDEGIGVHVIHALQQLPWARWDELTIIDGGTCPDAFQLVPEGIDKLIVVDAVRGGCAPGSIYRFTPEDVRFRTGTVTSSHQLGLTEGLHMIEHAGLKPSNVVIIGVEPKTVGWGLEISPELQAKIPQIIDLLDKEISGSSV
jgi:hydrogenase maturation protease